MIYPKEFEVKIGFDRIRTQLAALCSTNQAKEAVGELRFSNAAEELTRALTQADEMKTLLMLDRTFPDGTYVDTKPVTHKLRVVGTFLEPEELRQLQRALFIIRDLVNYFTQKSAESCAELRALTRGISFFPEILTQIGDILDTRGAIRDNASPELATIRRAIAEHEGLAAKRLQKILQQAQHAGYVDADVSISIREGRAVIPVSAANKRKIQGFIHDESATGKTFYVEPIEVVEINNELKELEYDERREIIRILTFFTDSIRPEAPEIEHSGDYLVAIDLIRAKGRFAITNNCARPILNPEPSIQLRSARHILLEQALTKEHKPIVPLDLCLTPDKRILVISGPNAGGKSVCLKTVALVQYMFQCGLLLPAGANSELALFDNIFLDIGDEQSMDNDLSTYSSHLLNMKMMLRHATARSLIFIDEFGSGTEPAMGGAIAESLLETFEQRGLFGVITTHYSNLKYYASNAQGVLNGAMSFDVEHIKPLFRLETGKPGSSFAIEIARKIGLPEELIRSAKSKIGSAQINIETQLRQIARDKNYWETKRAKIHQAEKQTDELFESYKKGLEQLKLERTTLLKAAKVEAQTIVSEANRQIEQTIREIRESQADKDQTKACRQRFEAFRKTILNPEADDEQIERKIERLKARQAGRRAQRAAGAPATLATTSTQEPVAGPLRVGSKVRIKEQGAIGEVLSLSGKKAVVGIGQILSTLSVDRLEVLSTNEFRQEVKAPRSRNPLLPIYDVSEKQLQFKTQIDVRGMRVEEALELVQNFVDQAIMLNISDISILHGKGTGALKTEIRRWLQTVDLLESARDEHVEFGGSGITVIKLDL